MNHFAVLCPEPSGHLNPMTALLSELRSRGNEVTWVGTMDGVARVGERGFDSVVIGREFAPAGTLEAKLAEIGELTGLAAARRTLQFYHEAMTVLLQEAPSAIRDCGATSLIADESIFASRTIADLVNLPWVTVCNALPLHPDSHHPPLLPAWNYRTGHWARICNRIGRLPGLLLLHPIARLIVKARQQHGLKPYDLANENASKLATVAQLPREFDYPRGDPHDWFHYVGALHGPDLRPPVEFPYERLDDRPLIYASLGTVQNRIIPVFREIARACCDLPIQLVISLGGGACVEDVGDLPGNPTVVEFAPQLDLVRRARLVITHAGMNTAMETIAQGVPMVAIPVTNDQPAVAKRIAWTGCGEVVPFRKATAGGLRAALCQVLEGSQYSENARRLAEANQRAGGIAKAADIIERSVSR